MRTAGVFALLVLCPLSLFALSDSDLTATQTVVPSFAGPNTEGLQIDITNLGAQSAGKVSFVAVLSGMPGARFASEYAGDIAPWTCTFSNNDTTATCTHPGPLKVGSSVGLRLFIAGSNAGQVQVCTTVSNATPGIFDPDHSNDLDCTCVNVRPCREIAIDVSTGFDNGVKFPENLSDPDWTVVSDPSGGASRPAVTYVVSGSWVNRSGAQWISSAATAAAAPGKHVFELEFGLPASVTDRTCILQFEYAADNSVVFTRDGQPIVTQTAGGFAATNTASDWFVGTPGTHTLRAVVTNLSSTTPSFNPTGLLVEGEVQCYCPYLLPVFPFATTGARR